MPLDDIANSDDMGASALPHNIEAEQAFLGALLYDNDIFYSVSDWFGAEHFYDPVHARIYDAAISRIARGALADAIVLKTDFERDGGLKEIGGASYLALLLEVASGSVAAVEYANLIYDLALRRSLIAISRETMSDAQRLGPEAKVSEVIDAIEAKIFAIAERGSSSIGSSTFSDAVMSTMSIVEKAYQSGGALVGLSTGFKSIDYKLGGLHPSDLIILAGRPSMGKTALATNIAFSIARAFNANSDNVNASPVGFFSLEMSKEQLVSRILSDYTGISSSKMRRGDLTGFEFEALRDGVNEIASVPMYIDDTGGISIATLCARARRMKRIYGIGLIVVDYLQLVTPSSSRGQGRVNEVSEVTQALKALAKELRIPVIALSQLSRQVEQRDDKKPQLSDLRESGSIEQDADVVAFVFREEYYKEREKPKEDTPEYFAWETEFKQVQGKAEFIIGKQRHGPICTIDLAFNGDTTRFSDLDRRE